MANDVIANIQISVAGVRQMGTASESRVKSSSIKLFEESITNMNTPNQDWLWHNIPQKVSVYGEKGEVDLA